MHHAHGIFDRHDLRHALGVEVDFSASEAWQDERILSRHQMRMVELGRDMNRQALAGERFRDERTVRSGPCKIAAKADECLSRTIKHRADGAQNIMPRLARNVEAEFLSNASRNATGGRTLMPTVRSPC